MSLINEALKRAQRENAPPPPAVAGSPLIGAGGYREQQPATHNPQPGTPELSADAGGHEVWLKRGAVALSAVLLAVLVFNLRHSPPEMAPGLSAGMNAKPYRNGKAPQQARQAAPDLRQFLTAAGAASKEAVGAEEDVAGLWGSFEEYSMPVAVDLPTTRPATMASVKMELTPPNPAPASAPATQPAPPEALKLGGIVQSNGQAHAIINDQMVGVGEEVAGARVLEIQRRQVILERGGQKIILRF